MRQDLLPPNSTPLETHLATAGATILQLGDDKIIGCKFDPPADWLLPLIAEYSLGELLPYFTDARKLLREGVAWARIRGTPQSLLTALSWQNLHARLEEEVVGVHFAEYQLHVDDHLSAEKLCTIVELAQLAQPVRSRLSRLYGGYDVRRLMLSGGVDEGALNHHFLSANSGMRPTQKQMPCLPWQADFVPPLLSFQQQYGSKLEPWRDHALELQSACQIHHLLDVSRLQVSTLFLDDLPEPWELQMLLTQGSDPTTLLQYQHQVWAESRWAESSWESSRTLVSSNATSSRSQPSVHTEIIHYQHQVWAESRWQQTSWQEASVFVSVKE